MWKLIILTYVISLIYITKGASLNTESCVDGVRVGNVYYRLLYRSGPKVNFSTARDLCIFHGGVLAEIPNETVYQAVFQYVKRSWYLESDRNYVQVWLNSVYDRSRASVFMRSGGRSYMDWFPGYPRSTNGHANMALEVPTSPTHGLHGNGMFNIVASHKAVPLCQFVA